MPLEFTKAEQVILKKHPDFSEKWLQDRIRDDPSVLGLGDVELVTAEKVQHKAGRLDLLVHDEQLNRRYEVELMLGATDPSHIMRCIEYWDIERRRYPAYDHVAVLVAEDITSRFLNVMSLLAGSIPLIAIQLVALKVDNKIALHFVRVLDQTSLREDDAYEAGDSHVGVTETDRTYWEQRAGEVTLRLSDKVLKIVSDESGSPHSFRFLKVIIDIVSNTDDSRNVWVQPTKALLHVGGYVAEPESWVKKFEDAGITASLKRGHKAVRATFNPGQFNEQSELLNEFIRDAVKKETVE